jgi:hypothetical protein
MRTLLIALIVLAAPGLASAEEFVYEGTWLTTNRKLDGPLTCVVTDLGNNQWHGHFYGSWQSQPFSYKVRFSGPADKLQGRAVIDGADYEWTGTMSKESFGWLKGSFGGTRYFGSFDMKLISK